MGGSESAVTGFKYYLTFAIRLVRGPVYGIHSIYWDNNLLWSSGTSPLTIASAVNGHVSISVPKRGTIDFYFGTDDQTANDLMTANTGYALPLRGVCYAVFRDFLLGPYNRVGSLKFVLTKYPASAWHGNVAIGDYDANPAHVLRHMIVDLCGVDASLINDTAFAHVADVLYAEGRGISGLLTGSSATIDYLETVLEHIRAYLRINGDGLLEPVLLRNDVALADMLEIGDADILEELDVSRSNVTELDNQVHGTYSAIQED